MVTAVNTALIHVQLDTPARQNYIKNNIKEIRITQTTGSEPSVSGNVLIAGKDIADTVIRSFLNTWLVSKGQ
jgi:hypothetical protein